MRFSKNKPIQYDKIDINISKRGILIMHKSYDRLAQLLCEVPEYAIEGKLNKNIVAELARKYDVGLINTLYSDKDTRELFFSETDAGPVFKKDIFLQFISQKEFLPDSYTAFEQKIGLASEGSLLRNDDRVVLNWPYKDCVLEGGQTKEDAKRDEVFFNEILAPDEINTIFEDKVLTNWKRYDSNGEHALDELKPEDNLIIKGNNLVVLHSLKKRFAGKVKLIYIDPPYYFRNMKGQDSFGYNSDFKLSTWLTFMKNRLEVSKQLLSSDGSIWISIGVDGQHYLKVLMDEVFGPDNFVADISWQKTYSPRNDSKGISNEVESVLVYSKNANWSPKKLPRTDKMNKVYKNPDNDVSLWRTSDAFAPGAATHQGMVYAIQNPVTGEMIYPYTGACWPLEQSKMLEEMQKWADYKLEDLNDAEERAKVCQMLAEDVRPGVKAIVLNESLETAKKKAEAIYQRGQWPKFFFTKKGQGGMARKTYLDESKGKVVTNFWPFNEAGHTDEAKKEIATIFGEKAFKTPKPSRLLDQIIKVATNEGDIVLDYFLGSGTTASVSHRTNRQYIGIEQMDYFDSLPISRLKYDVKECGGSLVYCYLKNDANEFRERVKSADNTKMDDLLNEVLHSSFLSYRIDASNHNVKLSDFHKLSLADKKHVLLDLIDNNTLYLNYSEIEDTTYSISEADKKHNKSFYGE